MSTVIKRLKQNNQEFVPITLAEAVVVNTNGIPGTIQEITTLDKVLRRSIAADNELNTAVQTINSQIEGLAKSKQDKLTAGYGINISDTNEISVTLSYTLYQIVTELPEASVEVMNIIYLLPSKDTEERNIYSEFVCLYNSVNKVYYWEKLGSFKADTDLSGYVTKTEMVNYAITAIQIKTSEAAGSANVLVDYDIPTTLYDSAVSIDQNDYVV